MCLFHFKINVYDNKRIIFESSNLQEAHYVNK